MKNRFNYSIDADRWDFRVSDKAFQKIRTLKEAQKRVSKDRPTGAAAMRDLFHSLLKSHPTMADPGEMDPKYLVNHSIMEAMLDLKEFDSIRSIGAGDPVGASIACSTLEPDLLSLFDQMKEAQEKADQLSEAMQQLDELSEQDSDQDAIEEAQEIVDRLQAELDDELKDTEANVQETMVDSLDDLSDMMEGTRAAMGWGMSEGTLASMSYESRLELAKKFSTPTMKELAELVGRLESMAMDAPDQSIVEAPEEIYDIELGKDLTRMLPQEIVSLTDEHLFYDWARRYTDDSLSQYALHGREDVSKGGMILAEDGSGSMSGDRAQVTKAFGLALLKIATRQHRDFSVIHFGSKGEYIVFDFDTSSEQVSLTLDGREPLVGMDAIVKYAELGFQYGGTDFETPLEIAVQKLEKEHTDRGTTISDVIMVTDGECRVGPEWLEEWNASKERLKFRTFGILVGSMSRTLEDICDYIVNAPDLLNPQGVGEVLREVGK